MTTKVNTYVLDNGLSTISSGTIKLALCQTEPLVLSDCTNLSGSGGKRVTTELVISGEVVLSDGAQADSRKIAAPSKEFTDGVTVGVLSGDADLWLAIYDATRLLLRTDGVTNQELVQGATIITPGFEFGINQ